MSDAHVEQLKKLYKIKFKLNSTLKHLKHVVKHCMINQKNTFWTTCTMRYSYHRRTTHTMVVPYC